MVQISAFSISRKIFLQTCSNSSQTLWPFSNGLTIRVPAIRIPVEIFTVIWHTVIAGHHVENVE